MTLPRALQVLDAIVAGAVEQPPLNDPPQSPLAGTCYLIGETPSGDWAQNPGYVAAFGMSGWRFVPPVIGMSVVIKSTGLTATFGTQGWDVGTARASRLLIEENQVVGPRTGPIADPSGGAIIDVEARTTLEQILASLRQHGLIG